jgi:hypothetical protein
MAGGGKHTKIGWYQECRDHSEPPPYKDWKTATDEVKAAWDEWEATHFRVGEDGIWTCEDNRLHDVCQQCTDRRQERAEDFEAYVLWHGGQGGAGKSGPERRREP